MPADTWHYMQNSNPDPYKYFINYVNNKKEFFKKYYRSLGLKECKKNINKNPRN